MTVISGAGGDDEIEGGGGADAIFGDSTANQAVTRLGGNDTILGGAGNDPLLVGDHIGFRETTVISGAGGNDTIWAARATIRRSSPTTAPSIPDQAGMTFCSATQERRPAW